MSQTGNPIFEGWYADPEIHYFEDRFWIYPTTSMKFDDQTYFEAFTSRDLVSWDRHGKILDFTDVSWSTNRCAWAPSCAYKNGACYFYFSAGDGAGLGVAVSESPGGPFRDALGSPIVWKYFFGAQPIDAHAFTDADGASYLYWGGWGHCVAAKLSDDMLSLVGEIVELTPEHYIEGPFMVRRGDSYYLMWSEGDWGDATYQVAYGRSDNPFGPFVREAGLFEPSPNIASSAGHHSVLQLPGSDRWVVAYHRRPLEETDPNHRVVCLEEMFFEEDGSIRPVALTNDGVRLAGAG
jgi:beta-xylosidase